MNTKDLAAKAEASWNKCAAISVNGSNVSCYVEKGRLAFYINGEKATRKTVEVLLK